MAPVIPFPPEASASLRTWPLTWFAIATVASALAQYAQRRAACDPLFELTTRLRRPVLWTLHHPVRAALRVLGGGR